MNTCCLACALAVSLAGAPGAEPSLTIDLGGGVKLEMALVAKGTFMQGSPPSEQGRGDDEMQRQVTLTEDFYLGKFPVTVGQFARFVRETNYRTEAERGSSGGFGYDAKEFPSKGLVQRKDFTWRNPGFDQTNEFPVTVVTYDDARAFAAWLAKKSHRKVSLPTEAQWEFACRGGTTTRFYNGDRDEDFAQIGWCRGNAGDGARPVGPRQPNRLGLFDMSGNVYEWCRDWYGPYEGENVKDPEETRSDRSTPPRRVLRGGSWLKEPRACRSAARWRNTPGSRNADNGFRIAAAVAAMVEQEDVSDARPSRPALAACDAGAIGMERMAAMSPFGYINLGGLICMLPCVFLVAIVVILLFVLLARTQRQPPYTQGPTIFPQPGGQPQSYPGLNPADDGFWLDLSGIAPGSIVHWRCLVGGVPREDRMIVEPGARQFVYTGGRPEQVTIVEVASPGGRLRPQQCSPGTVVAENAGTILAESPRETPQPPPPSHAGQPPFSGYPSAY